MPKLTAYDQGVRYLFKTGFDSYVSGTIENIFENEIHIKNVQMQIPPTKLEGFVAKGQEMTDHAIHSSMILPRVNIDWAVPVK